jgi:septal ring factor EnvC (AmiA/AmiB activator)
MIDPAWIALIGTICGGIGLKVAEHYLGRSKDRTDDASRIRDELRLQIAEQKAEIADLEKRLADTLNKYLDLRDEFMKISTELQIALTKIQNNGS